MVLVTLRALPPALQNASQSASILNLKTLNCHLYATKINNCKGKREEYAILHKIAVHTIFTATQNDEPCIRTGMLSQIA